MDKRFSMLTVNTIIKESNIHGVGLFAAQVIPKGTIVWKFTPGFDLKFTREDISGFPTSLQLYLYRYCWRSMKSGLYCFSSDNGKYFNHSDNPNTLSEYRDGEDEVVTLSLRNIKVGEELTDNYASFDALNFEDDILEEIALRFHVQDGLDARLIDAPFSANRVTAMDKQVHRRVGKLKRRRCSAP